MSDKITLLYNVQNEVTVLPNKFIDEYMIKADGEYVKIYLLILRLQGMGLPVDVDHLADHLELTRKDVLRALSYWEKAGLLQAAEPSVPEKTASSASTVTQKGASSQQGTPSPTITSVPEKTTLSPTDVENSMKDTDLERTIYMAETYIGRPFSTSELNSFCYINDQLHFSSDLMEYLIEYCVENGHKSMHYINKVALSWHEENITTVNLAKTSSFLYNKNCYCVLNAYGIKGRGPAASEIAYIRKWSEEYGFALEVILEACDRTMNSIHQPSFDYTDSILKRWKDKNVRQLKDIDAVDADYRKEKERAKELAKERKRQQQAQKPVSSQNNKFNNFDGRSYDMNDLERRLVQQ